MNNIANRQNEEMLLKFQYTARYYYNRAELFNYLVWILCILNIIINNVSLSVLYNIKMAIAFLLTFVTLQVEVRTRKYVEIGAAMRKYFDYHLFEFEIPNMFNGYSKDSLTKIVARTISKNPEKVAKQIKNSGVGNPQGVRDWYIGINPDDDITVAILECQKQNAFWDREISNKYIYITRTIIVFLVIIFLFAFSKETILEAISFMLSLSPLIVKVFNKHIVIKEYKSISKSIDMLLDISPNMITKEHLLTIQEKIDQRRLLTFITPRLLHKVRNKKLYLIKNQEKMLKTNT